MRDNPITIRLPEKHLKALRLTAEAMRSNKKGPLNISEVIRLIIDRDETILELLSASIKMTESAKSWQKGNK